MVNLQVLDSNSEPSVLESIVKNTHEIAKNGFREKWKKNNFGKGLFKDWREQWKWETEGIHPKRNLLERVDVKPADVCKLFVKSLFIRAQGAPRWKSVKNDLANVTSEFDPEIISETNPKKIFTKIGGNENDWNSDKRGKTGISIGVRKIGEFLEGTGFERLLEEIREKDQNEVSVGDSWKYVVKKVDQINAPQLGKALFCNALRSIGTKYFTKPDASLKTTFHKNLKLIPEESDFLVFYATSYLAEISGFVPRTIDKIFWLVKSKMAVDDGYIDEKYQSDCQSKWKSLMESVTS